MNLLEKFAAVEINAADRISPEDRAYCEKHQDAYDAARDGCTELANVWSEIVGTQKFFLEGEKDYKINLPNSRIVEIDLDDLWDHVEDLQRQFIDRIIQHFAETYHISTDLYSIRRVLFPDKKLDHYDSDSDENPYHNALRALKLRYEDIISRMLDQFDGRSFEEQALFQLEAACRDAALDKYDYPAYELKKATIRFVGSYCYQTHSYSYGERWNLHDNLKAILTALAYFETGQIGSYPGDYHDLLETEDLYPDEYEFYGCDKVQLLRLYKNGNCYIRFSSETNAQEFLDAYLKPAPKTEG